MPRLLSLPARLSVVIAILFAMTGSGFAHRVAPQQIDETLRAYVDAGGTLNDLCGDFEFGASTHTCDACRVVDGTTLLSAHSDDGLVLAFDQRDSSCTPLLTALPLTLERSHRVRAPPFV